MDSPPIEIVSLTDKEVVILLSFFEIGNIILHTAVSDKEFESKIKEKVMPLYSVGLGAISTVTEGLSHKEGALLMNNIIESIRIKFNYK